ncbi:MAG TPA: pyroglutamyl-peptidase I [Galbitalea sp.]|jgi:pyroglutamyl-peptidase
MTKILLTGFEPFDDAPTNPSWDAVTMVAEQWDGQDELVTARIPVVFAEAGAMMGLLITLHSPDIVIATGLANGRTAITPERVAINIEDARIADNAGDQPSDRPIDTAGPVARWSVLPIKAIVRELDDAGIPARVSDSAGTYVCNSLMYQLMSAVDGTAIVAGFVHVPSSPELAALHDEPSMELETIARGVRIAIDVTVAELQRRTL